jgi:hypothetical protein
MITAGVGATKPGNQGQGAPSRREEVIKHSAAAFLSAGNDTSNDEDDRGGILDQRRINEIFVRLKVAEISTLNFAVLGIFCGIFDYEISYDDVNDSEKTTRIILESL